MVFDLSVGNLRLLDEYDSLQYDGSIRGEKERRQRVRSNDVIVSRTGEANQASKAMMLSSSTTVAIVFSSSKSVDHHARVSPIRRTCEKKNESS